jgi:putative flippase GtrA
LNRQFIRFLCTGGIAAAVNLGSRYLLSRTMEFHWAVLLAYLFGMCTAWILSRLFVFEKSGRHWAAELGRFALVNVFAAAQVWLISVGLAEWLFPKLGLAYHREDIAHLIGVVVPVFTSYIGHKRFSFARTAAHQASRAAE